MYRVVDYIKDFLEYKGVEVLFTVTGGGSIFLNDAFSASKQITSIANHHEQASALAAEGYARMSNKIGVCVVTSGPGGTNAITGTLCSFQDSIPVLFISGNVRKELTTNYTGLNLRQLGDQEFNIADFVKPITKKSIQLNSVENLHDTLEDLYLTATTGRPGPVWLDIPLDIQKLEVDQFVSSNASLNSEIQVNEFKEEINFILDSIKKSEKPLFILGNGIRLSNSERLLLDILNKVDIPCVLSFNALDILESEHPNNFGRIGIVGNIHANKIVQDSDLIIALGTRLYVRQIGYNLESFGKNAKIIHIDIDNEELNKPLVKSDIKICGDINTIFNRLISELDIVEKVSFSNWMLKCNNYKLSNPIILDRHLINKPINPNGFLYKFSLLCPAHYSFVSSDGTANVTGSQVIQLKKNQRFFTNKGTAPMGYGLPAAIGAYYSNKNIICIEGDGSIQMNIQELQTIYQNDMNIKIIILNNNGYLSIKTTQKNLCNGNLYLSNPLSGLTLPNYSKIANAYGIKYFSLTEMANLASIVDDLFMDNGPAILEVFLDENAFHEPKIITKIDKTGKFTNPEFDDIDWIN